MPVLDIFNDPTDKEDKFLLKGVSYEDKESLKSSVKGIIWDSTFKGWKCPVALWAYNDIKTFAKDELRLGSYASKWVQALIKRADDLFHVKQVEDVLDLSKRWHWAYPYQRVDAQFHLKVGRSFDWSDPGTGKTLKAIIANVESKSLENKGRVIVVSPNTAKYNWRNEIQAAQDLINLQYPIYVYARMTTVGRRMHLIDSWIDTGGWLILNWEALKTLIEVNKDVRKATHTQGLLIDALAGEPVNFLTVDESHKGKNGEALQTKALTILATKCTRKLELTASPITVKPDDLYAGLHRLYPKQFSSYWWFINRYCQVETETIWTKDAKGCAIQRDIHHIGEGFNPVNIEEWHQIAGTISVRRRFEDVVKDVPEKQYKVLPIELTPEQGKLYKKASEDWLKTMTEEMVPIANAISLITYLRQICLDPAIVGAPCRTLPAKTSALLERLVLLDDKPLVVMSVFVKYIDQLEEVLTNERISLVRITGRETPEQRQLSVEKFQSGGVRVALCGVDAAGLAITLTRASHMDFTDRAWTKAANDQAEGRIRRIGQLHPQFFSIYTAEGTVEDRIAQSNQLKGQFEDAYINKTGVIGKKELTKLLLGGD